MGISFERFGSWVDKIASSGPSNEDPDLAFRNYHQAIRLKPKDPDAHYQRARAPSHPAPPKRARCQGDTIGAGRGHQRGP